MGNIPTVTFTSVTSLMMSTPVSTLQSTENNTLIIIAGSISTAVFMLLVVTILVISIVSVLVCRRRWYKTLNGNNTSSFVEINADKSQQSDGMYSKHA